jgi:CspA family cold shock protein
MEQEVLSVPHFPQGGMGLQMPHFTRKRRKKIMSKGKVKFFDTTKGFGFITQNQGEDLFFHVSELRAATANEGDQVEYEISEGKKGPCAVNIREAYSM